MILILDDAYCHKRKLRKPNQIEQCRGKCPKWNYSNWTPCSVSCGGGERTRTFDCRTTSGAVSRSGCSRSILEHTSEECNTHQCPVWSAGPWTDCSKSCETGLRSRMVSCFYHSREVEGKLCQESPRPVLSERCNSNIPCPKWTYSDWSDCSVTCGETGFQTRTPYCSFSEVDKCAHIPQEPIKRPCLKTNPKCEQPSNAKWVTTPWSQCSESCGLKGLHTRTVSCTLGKFCLNSFFHLLMKLA